MIRLGSLALASGLAAAAVWAADDQYGFMPDGGRSLLLGLLAGLDADATAEVLGRKAGEEDWAAWAESRGSGLDETAVATFAGYAALNLPVEKETEGQTLDELAAALPPDGKDLAVSQCQFCHSLFTGYLMHDRDRTGWEGTFKSPFHTEIPMSEVERKTFASYSALNMPLSFEDVPPELRF